MQITILDGYVDEPSNFGVPPYISPYPRYLAGAVREAGHEVDYVTIEQVRAGTGLAGDVLAVISGPLVPGRYLRGMPASEKELLRIANAFEGPVVLGGPLARFRYYDETLAKAFDHVAIRDLDACLFDYLESGQYSNRDRTMEEWDRWALLGADVIRRHPDFPEPLIVELDTSKGCVRYVNGGCNFCIEPMYGVPRFRPVEAVVAEVRALAVQGAVNFRLGGQADFLSYWSHGVGETVTPTPNVDAIRALLEGIHAVVPNLKVLHTDNGDPAMFHAHPREAEEAVRLLAHFGTGGNGLSFGLETADPVVTEANNLNAPPDATLFAIRLMNKHGRVRGENGMPLLLPGLNFVAGLLGETKETYALNLAFLKDLLRQDLWVRRINIRQVRPVRQEFPSTGLYREFRRFKNRVRREIDHEMVRRVVPSGTVLRDVYLEVRRGNLTYGRQVGSYPILVGLPYRVPLDRFVDVVVTDHGQRSVTAVEHPLDVNRASLRSLAAVPGIGARRAARIVRARPLASATDLVRVLDDPAVAAEVGRYFRFSAS